VLVPACWMVHTQFNRERFVNKPPAPELPPSQVWINRPATSSESSRDGSELAESAEPACASGEQELPFDILQGVLSSEKTAKHKATRKSGACDATAA